MLIPYYCLCTISSYGLKCIWKAYSALPCSSTMYINEQWLATNQMVLSINDKEEEAETGVRKWIFSIHSWGWGKTHSEIRQGHFEHEICNINSPHRLTESNKPLSIIAVSATKKKKKIQGETHYEVFICMTLLLFHSWH